MVAPQGQAIRLPLAVPTSHTPVITPRQPITHLPASGTPHKRPWEDQPYLAPYDPSQRPPHVSRATLHFENRNSDRTEPRVLHPTWVERPAKKHRAKPNPAQAAAHPYEADRVDRSLEWSIDKSLSREEQEGHPRDSWAMGMHDDQRESESPEFPTRPPSPSRETAEYTPVVWRRAGEGKIGRAHV